MLNSKQAVLDRLDFRAFYRAHIPSLSGEPQASGKCPLPGHEDKKASFSVNIHTGLFNCHGCGKKGDIFTFYQELKMVGFRTALKELAERAGVTKGSDKKPAIAPEPTGKPDVSLEPKASVNASVEGKAGREKAVYDYTDENGGLLYQVVRYEPKTFRPRRKGPDSEWVYNLEGVRRVPYNLPELVNATGAIIVEGEKDADNLKALGYTGTTAVTTSQGGAKGWRPEYSGYFLSKQVAIIPDNDRPGLEYAETVARSLHGKAVSIKIIELPGMGERTEKHGLDVSDWIELRRKEGGTDKAIKAKLTAMIKSASPWEPKPENPASQFNDTIYSREAVKLKVSTMRDILNYPNPEYLLEPILYQNTSNILTAYTGVGKSVLSMSIAHAIVTGLPLWGHFQVHRTGSVLIIDEENPGAFLKDRLIKMGFTEDMPLHFLHYQSVKLDDPACFTDLLNIIKEIKPALVVFDALIRLHSAKENDNTEMAHVMGKIRELINLTGITALIIHHDRKGQGDRKERARGGGDIVGAVDNQICLEPKDDDTLLLSPGKTRVAPFRPIKLKLEGEGDTLSFTYLGREAGEAEEVLNEIMEILEVSSLGVEDIKQALEGKGYPVAINRLRGILKQATGKKLLSDVGVRGKLLYRVNPTFTASRSIYTPLNCEAEKEERGQLHSFTGEAPLNCEAQSKKPVTVLAVLE